jgi:hypothetical protein
MAVTCESLKHESCKEGLWRTDRLTLISSASWEKWENFEGFFFRGSSSGNSLTTSNLSANADVSLPRRRCENLSELRDRLRFSDAFHALFDTRAGAWNVSILVCDVDTRDESTYYGGFTGRCNWCGESCTQCMRLWNTRGCSKDRRVLRGRYKWCWRDIVWRTPRFLTWLLKTLIALYLDLTQNKEAACLLSCALDELYPLQFSL